MKLKLYIFVKFSKVRKLIMNLRVYNILQCALKFRSRKKLFCVCVKEIDKRDFVTEKQGLNDIIPIRIWVIEVYLLKYY